MAWIEENKRKKRVEHTTHGPITITQAYNNHGPYHTQNT